jgi:1-aminocyclopropane-1-carboxylate deaminase/D-cysteine desulfhydrase-like pyridoxal-dependent ACC family enzyme
MASIFEVGAGKLVGPTGGGTVTQATSKATAVTLNTESGQITMNNAALAAAAEVSFTVNNDKISATDVVVVNHGSAGTAGAYLAQANSIAAGSFKITVSNVSSASKSEAIVLNFVALKGSDS